MGLTLAVPTGQGLTALLQVMGTGNGCSPHVVKLLSPIKRMVTVVVNQIELKRSRLNRTVPMNLLLPPQMVADRSANCRTNPPRILQDVHGRL